MRLRGLPLAGICLFLVGCTALGTSTSPELTEQAAVFERAAEDGDEPAADAAFFRIAGLLIEDPDRFAEDGRTGGDILLDIAGMAHDISGIPVGSCEVCTEEAMLGFVETDALALFLELYPDDDRVPEATRMLAPGTADIEDRVIWHQARFHERLQSAQETPD